MRDLFANTGDSLITWNFHGKPCNMARAFSSGGFGAFIAPLVFLRENFREPVVFLISFIKFPKIYENFFPEFKKGVWND